MKKFIISTVCALALAGALPVKAAQPPKIATVNLKSLFDKYYKTDEANKTLKDETTNITHDKEAWEQRLKTANDEYKKLLEDANDQAVSGEEREKRKKSADDKQVEARELEAKAESYLRSASGRFTELQRRMTDNILKDLREQINAKAKMMGYTMVLDTSGDTVNNAPTVLYSTGEDDLTESLLTELNLKAPAPDKPAEDKKDADKTGSK